MVEEFYFGAWNCWHNFQAIEDLLRYSAAVFLVKNNKSGSRSKHIDIKYLAIREHVKENKVVVEHISTRLMIVDPLTKGLPPIANKEHVEHMGLSSFM